MYILYIKKSSAPLNQSLIELERELFADIHAPIELEKVSGSDTFKLNTNLNITNINKSNGYFIYLC